MRRPEGEKKVMGICVSNATASLRVRVPSMAQDLQKHFYLP